LSLALMIDFLQFENQESSSKTSAGYRTLN
jgi:hypothetical protein